MFEKQRNMMVGKAKLVPSIDEDYSHSILRNAEATDAMDAKESVEVKTAAHNSHGAMIGSSIHIKGEITGDEDLLIEGTIDGNVNFNDKLVTVGQSGRVNADIYARVIRVEGSLKGGMIGTDKVIIAATGQVHGNITAPRITMEDGARFKGNVNMDSPEGAHSDNRSETKRDVKSSGRNHVVDASSMSARAVVSNRQENNVENKDEQLEQALMKARTGKK